MVIIMSKKILTIQDISCYGQCSITVALPILSSRGIETAILPSAILSTHTCGFKDFTVLDLTDEMPKIIEFTKYAQECGHSILEYTDIKELIKELYRNVK